MYFCIVIFHNRNRSHGYTTTTLENLPYADTLDYSCAEISGSTYITCATVAISAFRFMIMLMCTLDFEVQQLARIWKFVTLPLERVI